MSLENLAEVLEATGIEFTATDVLDLLWLASHLTPDDVGRGEPEAGSPALAEPGATAAVRPDAEPSAGAAQSAPAELHVPAAGRAPARPGGLSAAAVGAPEAAALGDRLALSRSLRPLKRRRNSSHEREVDEVATAHVVAQSGLWVPAMRPRQVRWMDLALVVDTGESMHLWPETAHEFGAVLQDLGAFRDIREWHLEWGPGAGTPPLIRNAGPGASRRSPRELIDPAGRRMIVVFSDCVSPRWQSAPAREVLAEWARAGPVAIAQPLPQRLWAHTSVSPSRVRFRTLAAGAPNAKIGFQPADRARHAPGPATPLVPIPVVQLSPPSAAAWSRLVSASGSEVTDGSAVLIEPPARPGRDGPPPAPPADGAELTAGPYVAGELIRRFQLVASPAAMRLAECLAAAPVSIPVMRLIQEAVLGGPDQAAVAEVFLGGLLCVTGPEANGTPGGERYDFVDGVRPQLLTRLPRRRALEVLRAVADSIDARLGRGREFRALVAGAGIVGELQVDADSLPFAIVAEQVLARMGADFAPSVRQLRELLGTSAPQVGQSPAVTAPREPTAPADGRAGSMAIRPDLAEAPGAPAAPGVADPDGTAPGAPEAAPRADRGWQAYSEALAGVPVLRRRTSSRPLACPYCYYAFGGSDIVFRCEGSPAPGRPRCQQLPDEVLLREMQISTPVFPAFQPGTRREAAPCPLCGGLSRSLACPSCHSPLPPRFRSVDSRMIALIGSSDSGKSAFMTVLIHELRRSIGQSLGSSTGAADATTEDRFARNYDGPLYRDSRLLERTRSAQSHIQPLVFRFTMPGRARWRTRDREILLSFVDSAGEDLASMTSLEMLTRYLSAADAVILMVDPLQLDAVRQEIVAPIALPAQPPPLHDPVSSVERVTRILSLVAGADTIDKPVAVVLSKLDAVAGLLGADSPLLAPSPGTSYFSLPDSDRVQAAATEFLERVGAGGISAILTRWYSRWRYFAVSALGSPPTVGNELSQPSVRPHRIADPLLWILSELGLVPQSSAEADQ